MVGSNAARRKVAGINFRSMSDSLLTVALSIVLAFAAFGILVQTYQDSSASWLTATDLSRGLTITFNL